MQQAPRETGAMRLVGVLWLHDTDRYPLQASRLKHLVEVVQHAPEAKGAQLTVDHALQDRPPPEPRVIPQKSPEDALRVEFWVISSSDLSSDLIPSTSACISGPFRSNAPTGGALTFCLIRGCCPGSPESLCHDVTPPRAGTQARALNKAEIAVRACPSPAPLARQRLKAQT